MISKLLRRNLRGATAVEYGLLTLFISSVAIGSTYLLGQKNASALGKAAQDFAEAGGPEADGGTGAPISPSGPPIDCYDASNVGVVGNTGSACNGLLIVDTATLRASASPSAGGDGSFSVTDGSGTIYTFADDARNIFTGQVTDFSDLFAGVSGVPEIGYWDVSRATTLDGMFSGSDFNGDISGWQTGQVTSLDYTFSDSPFNGSLAGWDTSNVQSMLRTFQNATAFNQSLAGWNTSQVTTMQATFQNATAFNGSLAGWTTDALTYSRDMFNGAIAFNQPLPSWNMSQVTSFNSMFDGAAAFNQDISTWQVPTTFVTSMRAMLRDATSFNQDLSGWCADHAGSPPLDFDTGATAWAGGSATRPTWGPC